MAKSPRRLSQESLSEAHEKYQTLLEHLSVGVYRNTSGPKGHFLEANSAIVAMFEAKSKEEFMKHNVSDFYQDPAKRQEFVVEILKHGEVKNKEIELVTLKGKKIIGSVSAVMKKTESGEIYFDGIVEDVTEHKKMEEELRLYREDLEVQVEKRTLQLQELNKKLSSEIAERKKTEKILQKSNDLLEGAKKAMLNVMEDLENAKVIIEKEKAKDDAMLASIGEGLIAVDNNCKIMIMNRAAEELLGWKATEMIGKDITSLPIEDEEGVVLPFKQRPTFLTMLTGKTTTANYFFVRKDKTRFPIAINVTPIKLGGKIVGAIDIFRDITHEKEIDRAKSEFVSLASHQLRTPLGIMKWYLEAIQNETYFKTLPSPSREYFKQIYKSNERVLALVRDLLSVSRIDQGSIKDVPKRVDLAQVVKEIVGQMQIIAREKKVKLSLTISHSKISLITIDPLRLHEVIENVLANAVEYTRENGLVEVRICREGDLILISVRDTGIGISASDQKKLFTKFFRAENAVTVNSEGSGLGLYVVKSYVKEWGGEITVESTIGKGSTFIISLPLNKIKEVKKL